MIQSLSVQGFKSFAERVRLEFGPGITAIIGPNGSGKSNVVEAIRWASHHARARELRAGRATELVFHGSGGKAPLGFAEVQLELKATAERGRLNLARRIYKDGSAEQDLAGKPARARDVQGALRGTGLGPGGLAVIGQGEVSGVVQAEGRTLLGYLQEAAGLSASVAAQAETETRLGGADAHLAQLRLLEDEMAGQVRRLARAAEDARRARDLEARETRLNAALARARSDSLRADLGAARAREAELLTHSDTLGAEIVTAGAQLEDLREQLQRAAERRSAHAQALDLLRAAEAAHSQAKHYLERLEAESSRLAAERAGLNLSEPASPAPDLNGIDTALAAAREGASRAERAAQVLDGQLVQARASAARTAQASARSQAELETLGHELAGVETRLSADTAELERVRAELSTSTTAREARDAELAQAQQALAATRAQGRERAAEAQSLTASRAPLARERARLDAQLSSYARYGEGARNALRSDHPGIVGAVADLLTVPADYETAVTAALGRRLEQVVVQTSDDARAVIDHLKTVGGRATFLPLDLLRPRPRRDGALRREAGVLGNLADLCPSEPAIVGQNLLTDTLLVSDLRAATRIARSHASRPRLVTVEGELIEPGGALTGGRLRDAAMNHLSDARRLAELDEELEALDARLAQLSKAEEKQVASLAAVETALTSAQTARDESAQAERTLERRAAELGALLRGATAQRDTLRTRLSALDQPAPQTVDAPLPDLATLEADLQGQREAATTARTSERALQDDLLRARELHAAWRSFERDRARDAELAARLAENTAAAAEQAGRAESSAGEVERRRTAVSGFDEGAYTTLDRARQAAAQAHATLIGRQNTVRAELEQVRLTAARREASLQDLPPLSEVAGAEPPPGTPREWQAELNRLTREREALGPVNARAESEHVLEAERLASLSAERGDAEEATLELRVALEDLSRESERALTVAFGHVTSAFADYSAELLGGEGALEPERDEAGRLVGLRLAVQPRGKRTRSMTLLSAGERTMAGLAFLFALNHATEVGGLPLAVLDEVDAPLDEANIRRFTAFLQVLAARGAQFILVTHQKATMEVADALWGVTTDASGASRVLSIRQAGEGVPAGLEVGA